jgi:methionyl-tRNA synthetase
MAVVERDKRTEIFRIFDYQEGEIMGNKVKEVQESRGRRCERCGKLLWNGLEGPLCLECMTSKKAKK